MRIKMDINCQKKSSEQFSAGMDTMSTQSNIAINTTNC